MISPLKSLLPFPSVARAGPALQPLSFTVLLSSACQPRAHLRDSLFHSSSHSVWALPPVKTCAGSVCHCAISCGGGFASVLLLLQFFLVESCKFPNPISSYSSKRAEELKLPVPFGFGNGLTVGHYFAIAFDLSLLSRTRPS